MSRTATTLKFKMCLFLDEASYWAEKLLTDVNLPPLKPDADNNFGGSLGLDFRKWWRHVQPKSVWTPAVQVRVKEFRFPARVADLCKKIKKLPVRHYECTELRFHYISFHFNILSEGNWVLCTIRPFSFRHRSLQRFWGLDARFWQWILKEKTKNRGTDRNDSIAPSSPR